MSNDQKQDPGKGGDQDREDKLVPITIEKKPFKSPNPTTGAALYALGQVPAGYELFREVHGKGDDESIANNAAAFQLKPGDHFYFAQSSLNPGTQRV